MFIIRQSDCRNGILSFDDYFPIPVPEQLIQSNKDVYNSAVEGNPASIVDLGSIIEYSDFDGCGQDALYCYQEASRILNKTGGVDILNPTSLPSSDFKKLKSKILELTGNEQVTKSSHPKTGGIYMMYIDHFDDDFIIPFYVGKTNSFSRRLSQHISGIKKLIGLPKRKYNSLVEEGEFDGQYLYCKMYAYLDSHNCTIKDVKMVILEEEPNEKKRSFREDDFIQSLSAPFFGFNQYLFFTHFGEYQSLDPIEDEAQLKSLLDILKKEIPLMAYYYHYGYNAINIILTLPMMIAPSFGDLVFYKDNSFKYLGYLKEYRSPLKNYTEVRDVAIEKAQKEVDEGIVTVIPCPAADEAREKLKELFANVEDSDVLIDLCIDAIFRPDSISSVKIWSEAKKRGFWDDPLYEFKKRYPSTYQFCVESPIPIPPADTLEKKVALIHRQMMRAYYARFFFVTT